MEELNLLDEVWKDIKGYEGLYQVSNLGNVKSIFYRNQILKQTTDRYGYKIIYLYKNKIRKTFKVHRLVATMFIDNPENKAFIDHINTVKNDNRVENLRWVTASENNNNELTLAKYKKYCTSKSKSVICLNNNIVFKTISSASKFYNINRASIDNCCKGKYKTAGKLEDGTRLKWAYYGDI